MLPRKWFSVLFWLQNSGCWAKTSAALIGRLFTQKLIVGPKTLGDRKLTHFCCLCKSLRITLLLLRIWIWLKHHCPITFGRKCLFFPTWYSQSPSVALKRPFILGSLLMPSAVNWTYFSLGTFVVSVLLQLTQSTVTVCFVSYHVRYLFKKNKNKLPAHINPICFVYKKK